MVGGCRTQQEVPGREHSQPCRPGEPLLSLNCSVTTRVCNMYLSNGTLGVMSVIVGHVYDTLYIETTYYVLLT